MDPPHVPAFVTRLGTVEYLDMCDRALARQRHRLVTAEVLDDHEGMELGRSLIPDVWLTLVALSGALQAVKLAGSVSSTHRADIDLLSRQLVAREEIRRARNVYEHLDEYLAGRGNIQKAEGARHDMHLPQVGITGGAGGISRIEVRIGADPWVDVFSAIDSARGTLERVTALLNSEA